MFGHQDEMSQHNNGNAAGTVASPSVSTPSNNSFDNGQQAGSSDNFATNQQDNSATSNQPSLDYSQQQSGDVTNVQPPKDILSPAGGYPQTVSQQFHNPSLTNDDVNIPEPAFLEEPEDKPEHHDTPNANDHLSAIKIQALDELYPLIDNLDLNPEERFRTLMMMIQASDNQDLVELAYQAAHQISDEKIKAQALLDIVNEINYFTQHLPQTDQ
jgi:hypothetical protein